MLEESRFDSRVGAIKLKFRELDKNNDHSIDFNEIKDFLREGRPEAKDRELKWQFQQLDKGRRGKIHFSEFCDFVYKDVSKTMFRQGAKKPQSSLTEAIGPEFLNRPKSQYRRNSDTGILTRQHNLSDEEIMNRLSAPTALEAAGVDWEATSKTFYAYAGADKMMQGNEFARLCRDCSFFDLQFTAGHSEHIFRRCLGKGESALRKRTFRDALMLVATAKGEPAAYIRSVVSNVLNQPNSLGASNDIEYKPLKKSASATGLRERPRSQTGLRERPRSRALPRLPKTKGIDLAATV